MQVVINAIREISRSQDPVLVSLRNKLVRTTGSTVAGLRDWAETSARLAFGS